MFNKKKKAEAAEAERAQRKQIAALRVELDEMSRSRSELQERIAGLSDTNDELDRRLAALDQGVQSMGEQIVTLSSSTTDTNQRMQAIDDRFDRVEEVASELEAINQRLQSFEPAAATAPPPTPPPTPTPPPPPPASTIPSPLDDSPLVPTALPPLIEFDSSEGLDERVAELRDQLGDLARQTSSIDARVTSVSMELANQLTELSSDIDELNRRAGEPDGGSNDVDTHVLEARLAERLDVAIDDVLDSTERLAAEQARYEIQFRADLAELAERIRRPGTT